MKQTSLSIESLLDRARIHKPENDRSNMRETGLPHSTGRFLQHFQWNETLPKTRSIRWSERTRSCQKAVVVKAEAMLQYSKKYSNRRQFMECESEAVAFATTPVTTVNFSHNLVLATTHAPPRTGSSNFLVGGEFFEISGMEYRIAH